MGPDRLRDRITDQFSYRGQRADVWRAFDLMLDTGAFLNLGYSRWYQSHLVGSSQRRLAAEVGRTLATHLPATEGRRLLDVGCGRGGPAVELATQFGFRVLGVDLVVYNISRARENGRARSATAEFIVGDATRLPLDSGSVPAVMAMDAFVYLPDRKSVFAELARVLQPGGVLVFTDLLARQEPSERDALARFADAWDMPPPGTSPSYEGALSDAGFDVRTIADLTPHSVGRFRKWTAAFELFWDSPARFLIERLLGWFGIDAETVAEQVRRAHEALPSLRHVMFVADAERVG